MSTQVCHFRANTQGLEASTTSLYQKPSVAIYSSATPPWITFSAPTHGGAPTIVLLVKNWNAPDTLHHPNATVGIESTPFGASSLYFIKLQYVTKHDM